MCSLSESVMAHLSLGHIQLNPNFDLTKLQNLKELELGFEWNMNVKKFIEFLRLRPKLEVFHHRKDNFVNFTEDGRNIAEIVFDIRDCSGEMFSNRNMYEFISEL